MRRNAYPGLFDKVVFAAGNVTPRALVITYLKESLRERPPLNGGLCNPRIGLVKMPGDLLIDIVPFKWAGVDGDRLRARYQPIVYKSVLKVVVKIASMHEAGDLLNGIWFRLNFREPKQKDTNT